MAADGANSVIEHVATLRNPVVRPTARDLVADKIAGLIAAGIVQVGDLLPGERDLAGAFHVSRETVRAGMQILAGRGLIEIWQGARSRVVSSDLGPIAPGVSEVRRINAYDIETVHAARKLVESEVVARAARRIDRETLDFLDSSLLAQRAALDDPVRFLISDREFHFAIYYACGNRALADFVGDLYAYMMEWRRRAVAQTGAILNSVGDHEAILGGLRRHDADAVVAGFNVHLDRIYQTTRRVIENQETPRKTRTDPAGTGSDRRRQ
jgi:DNA-binding FadR family transcriptional regulator